MLFHPFCAFTIPGEGQRALRLLALVREREGLALVPGVADVAHVLRGMSWGGGRDTSRYNDIDDSGDSDMMSSDNDINSSSSTSAGSSAGNNSSTATSSGNTLVLGGHLSVVMDLIVQQSLREKHKRETPRSSPQHSQSSQSQQQQQQQQQAPQSQQQGYPVLSITTAGATVLSNSSNSISNANNNEKSDSSGFVDMGSARALSSALVTSLCRQGNILIITTSSCITPL